jgi:hypothetical protein
VLEYKSLGSANDQYKIKYKKLNFRSMVVNYTNIYTYEYMMEILEAYFWFKLRRYQVVTSGVYIT